MNKKALYESIMLDVSKIIKKHLNEASAPVKKATLTPEQRKEIKYIQINDVIKPAVEDSNCKWIYDDFLFDYGELHRIPEIYLPVIVNHEYDDFTRRNFGGHFDDLDPDLQLKIAKIANIATKTFFEGDTTATYRKKQWKQLRQKNNI